MKWFVGIGLFLTFVGIGFAVSALATDHRRNGTRPLMPWIAPTRAWIQTRVLRRRPQAVAATGSAALSIGASINAEGLVIPGENAPVDQQISYLRQEAARLRGKIAEEAAARQDAVNAAYDRLHDADTAISDRVTALDERTVDLASGSTWRQIWGLIFVAVGSALMAVPPLLGWS